MKCQSCEKLAQVPPGPALRERMFLWWSKAHYDMPRFGVCSIECFEVEIAAFTLLQESEPTALDGFFIKDMSTPEQLKQGIVELSVKVETPAIQYITLDVDISV